MTRHDPIACRALPDLSVHRAQRELRNLTAELENLDQRLAALADLLPPSPDTSLLTTALADGVTCVRTDLLRDAIDTLTVLAHQTEDGASRRHGDILTAAERLVESSWAVV